MAVKVVRLDHLASGAYSPEQQRAALRAIEEEAALGLCLRHPNVLASLSAFTLEEQVMAVQSSGGAGGAQAPWRGNSRGLFNRSGGVQDAAGVAPALAGRSMNR